MSELGYPPDHTTAGTTEQWADEQAEERACNRGLPEWVIISYGGIMLAIGLAVGIILGVVLS